MYKANDCCCCSYPNADVEDWDAAGRTLRGNSPVVNEWIQPAAGALPEFTYIDLSVEGNTAGVVKNDSTMGPYNAYGTGSGSSAFLSVAYELRDCRGGVLYCVGAWPIILVLQCERRRLGKCR